MGKIFDEIINHGGELYHITDARNLKSILDNGILSLDELIKNGISPKFATDELSRKLDTNKKLDEYVNLAYTHYYDMFPKLVHEGKFDSPVLIIIKPEIINEQKVLFSDRNSAANDAVIYEIEDEAYDSIDFQKVYIPRGPYNYGNIEYKNARQAEILVKKKIDCKYIKKVKGILEEELEKFIFSQGIEVERSDFTEDYKFHY